MAVFDPAQHPRGPGGRFATTTVGGKHLDSAGVTKDHSIVVHNSRVRKYAGHDSVESFVAAHPKGRATALRELATDHKAGKIGFTRDNVSDLPKVAPKAPKVAPKVQEPAKTFTKPEGPFERVTSGVKGDDFIVSSAKKSTRYPDGIKVADYLAQHPKGQAFAAKVIAGDVKAGRASIQRTIAADVKIGADVSAGFKKDVEGAWRELPKGARDLLKTSGATFHAPKRLIDTAPELADQVPRGWAAGSTWKNVGGVYMGGADKKIVVAETSLSHTGEWISEGRAKSVLMHEAGHGIDDAMNQVSYRGEFRQAYSRDVAAYTERGGKIDDDRYAYFLQPGAGGPSEMFAEQFASAMGHPTNPRDPPLDKQFPDTAAYMRKLLEGLK